LDPAKIPLSFRKTLTSNALPQFFDFQTMKLISTLTVNGSVTAILLQRDNGLLAVTCDDLVLRIVDIETRRIVRELSGPRGRILDVVSGLTTSPNLRQSRKFIRIPAAGLFSRLALDHRRIARLGHPHL
jgi:WD40 repeat protein